MIVALGTFAQLAAACGPTVHVDTLAAIARTESGFHALAINDNTGKRRYLPKGRGEAVAIASRLLARRHNVDLGLMQVNSANFAVLGLSVADAFDPCKSIAAGARVLVGFYRRPAAGADPQGALLRALSGYNTGSHTRGFVNGYVAKVQASAEAIVPAIRVRGGGSLSAAPSAPELTPTPAPERAPSPPAWDVYAQARAAREDVPQDPAAGAPPVLLQVVSGTPGGGR
jgi:type IV secretion system protein VirB1